MTQQFTLTELVDAAEIRGGGTFRFDSGCDGGTSLWKVVARKEGYFVSLDGGIERLPGLYTPVLRDFARPRDAIARGEHYLGLWRDDDGLWSVDETVWTDSIAEAYELARSNGQRAFWDIEDAVAIIL